MEIGSQLARLESMGGIVESDLCFREFGDDIITQFIQ
jgi:hypothetical protein